MYLDKLSTQGRVPVVISRQVINTGEGPLYLDKLSRHGGGGGVSRQPYQHRGGLGVSRQVINTGEGWVYLDKLSTQGRVGCI